MAVGMAQKAKGSPCKPKDPSSISGNHVDLITCASNLGAEEAETGESLETTDQSVCYSW